MGGGLSGGGTVAPNDGSLGKYWICSDDVVLLFGLEGGLEGG